MSNGIFFDNGNSLAQSRIEADEEMALNSSLKTVTFKAPDYVVEAIDAFASHSGSTRSSLISDILTQYFAHAFVDFSEGYLANFNSDSPLEYRIRCEALSLAEKVSDNAAHFITRSVTKVLEG